MEDIKNKRDTKRKALDEVAKAIKHINYGEVVITIHDSRIVQIEKREKKRFSV